MSRRGPDEATTMVIAAFGIAALSSVDNLSVGFGYALKSERIGVCANGVVALINSSGMLAMMFVGQGLVRAMPSSVGSPARVGSVMAGILYIGIGLWEGGRLANVYLHDRDAMGAAKAPATPELEAGADRAADGEALTLWLQGKPTPELPKPELPPLETDLEAPQGSPCVVMCSDSSSESEASPDRPLARSGSLLRAPGVARNFVLFARLAGMSVRLTRRRPPETEEGESSMGYREALVVGLALTGSNVAAGIGAGAVGMDPTVTTLATFICSFAFMAIGQILGAAIRKGATLRCDLSHNQVAVASAVIFFILGVVMLAS
mmetsp:Transcript_2668/g.8359  ORF Transcript_2668/g.8359 Transcript_2668/m.8359 type:complete len:320 (-) Transcript_2668:335-1294(-)